MSVGCTVRGSAVWFHCWELWVREKVLSGWVPAETSRPVEFFSRRRAGAGGGCCWSPGWGTEDVFCPRHMPASHCSPDSPLSCYFIVALFPCQLIWHFDWLPFTIEIADLERYGPSSDPRWKHKKKHGFHRLKYTARFLLTCRHVSDIDWKVFFYIL